MVRKTPMYGTPPGSLKEDLAEHHKPATFSRIQVAVLVRIGVAAFSRIARPLSTEFCRPPSEAQKQALKRPCGDLGIDLPEAPGLPRQRHGPGLACALDRSPVHGLR